MNPNPPNSNPKDPGGIGGALPTGAMLRAAADGELSSAQHAELQGRLGTDPASHGAVRFEQQLRAACSRAMSSDGVRAPDRLRQAVLAQVAAEATAADGDPVVARIHEGGRVEVPVRRRRFGGLLAAAAAIPLLVAGGLLLLNHRADSQANRKPSGVMRAVETSVMPVEFLTREHCEFDAHSFEGLEAVTPEQIPERMRQLVGRPLGIEDLEKAGFEFVRMGKCQIPGGGETAHLLFSRHLEREDGTWREILLSLFVVNDKNRHRMTEGILWQSPAESKRSDGPTIRAWARDGLIYYLVTDCGASRKLAQQELDAPETTVMCEPPADTPASP